MDLEAAVNVTVDPKWLLRLNLPKIVISGVQLSQDHVGMIARNYDSLMSAVVRSIVNTVNAQWSKPFDITSIDP